MSNYEIVRVIKEFFSILHLICIFPEGNRYIDVISIAVNNGFRRIWKIQLDLKASKEGSLTTTPEYGLQI
jgi:hypothetical protein